MTSRPKGRLVMSYLYLQQLIFTNLSFFWDTLYMRFPSILRDLCNHTLVRFKINCNLRSKSFINFKNLFNCCCVETLKKFLSRSASMSSLSLSVNLYSTWKEEELLKQTMLKCAWKSRISLRTAFPNVLLIFSDQDHIPDIFWSLWVIFLMFSDRKSLYLRYYLISPDHISCWNLLLDLRAIHSHQPKLKAWQCKIEEKASRKCNQGNVKSNMLKQEIFLSRETHGEALERSYQGRDREEGHWSFGQPRIRLW